MEVETPPPAAGSAVVGDKRKREDEAGGAVSGSLSIELDIKQGLSTEVLTQLRANNRTARCLMTLTAKSAEDAKRIASILKQEDATEQGWVSVMFALSYATGEPVDMRKEGKFPDAIDVMEPTGSSKSEVKHYYPTVVYDSRAEKGKKKLKGANKEPFSSYAYLETTYPHPERPDPKHVLVELKFATNITSRQHDRNNFNWAVTVDCDLGDGKEEHTRAKSTDFEYVARQLKPAGGKKAKAGGGGTGGSSSAGVKKKKAVPKRDKWEDDSEPELNEPEEELPQRHERASRQGSMPRTFVSKGGRRTSTRQRHTPGHLQDPNEAYDQDSDGEMQERRGDISPPVVLLGGREVAGKALRGHSHSSGRGSSLALSRDDSLNTLVAELGAGVADELGLRPSASGSKLVQSASRQELAQRRGAPRVEIPLGRQASADHWTEVMLKPTAGGRNLSRTESIDRIFKEEQHPSPTTGDSSGGTSLERQVSVGDVLGMTAGVGAPGGPSPRGDGNLADGLSSFFTTLKSEAAGLSMSAGMHGRGSLESPFPRGVSTEPTPTPGAGAKPLVQARGLLGQPLSQTLLGASPAATSPWLLQPTASLQHRVPKSEDAAGSRARALPENSPAPVTSGEHLGDNSTQDSPLL